MLEMAMGRAPLLSAASHQAQDRARHIEDLDRAIDGGAAVAIVRWPEERTHAEALCAQQLPCLLLVGPDTPPPLSASPLTDWVRLPASVTDLRVRLLGLRAVAVDRPPRPLLDGDGRLLYRDRWVALAPRQEDVAHLLVAHFEQTVRTSALLHVGIDGTTPSHEALRSRVHELRRNIAPLGLDIVAIRSVGYLLEPSSRQPAQMVQGGQPA
jgi:hypothetical protein